MTQEIQKLVEEYLANHEIIQCPPALGKGGEQSEATKRVVREQRRKWRQEHCD